MSAGARVLELSAAQQVLLEAVAAGGADAATRLEASLATAPIRLSVEVLSTKRVDAGAGVSYGHRYVTATETTLALVAIGYGHGIPRKSGNAASVTLAGGDDSLRRLPIVGRVAMDVLVVDLGEVDVPAGGRVVLFGAADRGEIALDEWAASVGENPVAVIAALDARVLREVHP